jgi:opacity protein-like surface antigen
MHYQAIRGGTPIRGRRSRAAVGEVGNLRADFQPASALKQKWCTMSYARFGIAGLRGTDRLDRGAAAGIATGGSPEKRGTEKTGMKYLAVILFFSAAFGQQYEIGANVGYGFYRDGSIYSDYGTAQAGIRNRFAAGITLADQFSKYVSAEFRYLYHDGHPFLQAPGVKSDIQGQSDALTGELLFHFRTREHRLRPFLAGGSGAKEYIIAGPEPFPQAIPQIASLTTNDAWKVAFSVGGGVKCRLIPHMLLRADFRDYLTTFPRRQIVPAPHNTARGVFEQFTPLFGVSYIF